MPHSDTPQRHARHLPTHRRGDALPVFVSSIRVPVAPIHGYVILGMYDAFTGIEEPTGTYRGFTLFFSLSQMGLGCVVSAHTPSWVQAVPLHPDTWPVVIALIM